MIIIGITGKMQAGKDSFADAISKTTSIPVIKLSFADALKEEVWERILKPDGIPKEALYDERKKYFRLILQGYGTDFRRNFCSNDYWTLRLNEKLKKLRLENFEGIVTIPDVRFQDEVDLVEEWGMHTASYLVSIERPEAEENKSNWIQKLIRKYFHKDPPVHASESLKLKPGSNRFFIRNDGSLDDLRQRAKEFCDGYLPR